MDHEHEHMSAKKCGRLRSVIKMIEKEHRQHFHPAFIVGVKIEHVEMKADADLKIEADAYDAIVFSIMIDPEAAEIEEIAQLKERADELFGELDDAPDDPPNNEAEAEPGFILPGDESEPS